jgi:hypothetical protein
MKKGKVKKEEHKERSYGRAIKNQEEVASDKVLVLVLKFGNKRR